MNSNEHYYEACYQVWRRGGNPDRVRFSESDNDHYYDREPEVTANRELERQMKQRQDRIDAENETY